MPVTGIDVQALCPCNKLGVRAWPVEDSPVVNGQLAHLGRVDERLLVGVWAPAGVVQGEAFEAELIALPCVSHEREMWVKGD